ncbi:MAG TPA: hypothetical protein VI566_02530 [Xanthomonadales bacterium]|nr:hypothetical protein [Xanthomonadales bacterium]
MSLKSLCVALVSFTLLLGAGTTWPQPPTAGPERVDERGPVPAEKRQSKPPSKPFPQDVPGLQAVATEAYEAGDYMRFIQANIQLRKLRPFAQQYMVGMVVGGALIGRAKTAYNSMHVMQQQGLSYDFNSTEDTQSVRGTEVYDYLNGLLIEAGKPMGEGRVAFTLPPAAVRPEAITWDDSRGSFLVGTAEGGVVLAVTPGGEIEELLRASDENGLLAITGVAVDAARKKLWLSSAGVPGYTGLEQADLGRGALFEFNLDSLELINRYAIPEDGLPHVPGSLELTPAGDVYLIDRVVPMVFRKMAGSESLEPYLASREMLGFMDLALSDDGKTLYLADADLGILVVDLENGSSASLGGPETLNLGGISGLSYSEGSLFMVQNGITPQRLMRLQLDPAGKEVSNVTPLAIALPEFTAPSFGTVQSGALYYFADGNLPGEVREPAPVIVLKSPLLLSEDIIPAEKRKFDADTWGGNKSPYDDK